MLKRILTKAAKLVLATKDYLVKDNVGLHFTVAYIVYDISLKWNFVTAIVGVLIGIFLMEVFDKFVAKGIFSIKDIVAGLLGLGLAYFINTL